MPLILYHAGFGWGGLLENVLWVLFALVYLSGFFGLAVQQVLPRIMTTRVPLETFKAQVPYQCQRMQFLADRLVSETCGKLSIRDEPIYHTFKKLAEFGSTATREELGDWPDQVPAEHRGLFLDLATYSKQQKWINQENNFPKLLVDVYVDMVPEEAPKPAAKPAEVNAEVEKKASPLDQMKAKKAAAPAGEGEKKLSPLEQMKAKKAAAATEGEGEKKLSPLEQMKAKAAKKKAAGGEEAGEGEKKLSPLEQMKAKAAAKKAAESGGEEKPAEEPEKKLSPLEQMKAKAALKKKAAESDGEVKKLSPLEQMKAKAAAKKKTAENAEGNGSQEPAVGVAAERMPLEPPKAEATPEGPIVIPCPECEHEMKLPDKSLLGFKARCPLCGFKFVLELPEEPEPVLAAASVSVKAGPSPIKQAMLQDAGGAKPSAKLSPLEQMKAKAAAKAGGTATAEKPLSPVEKMRAAKAKTTTTEPAPKAAPKKKKATLKVPKKKQKTYTGPIPRAGELREFYLRQIRPYLGTDSKTTPQLAVDAQSKRLFSQMRSDLPGELHDTLNQLEDFVDERRQFSLQTGIHHWLHWWLFLHIPLSMGLYILMIAHIIMALIVDPELFWG